MNAYKNVDLETLIEELRNADMVVSSAKDHVRNMERAIAAAIIEEYELVTADGAELGRFKVLTEAETVANAWVEENYGLYTSIVDVRGGHYFTQDAGNVLTIYARYAPENKRMARRVIHGF